MLVNKYNVPNPCCEKQSQMCIFTAYLIIHYINLLVGLDQIRCIIVRTQKEALSVKMIEKSSFNLDQYFDASKRVAFSDGFHSMTVFSLCFAILHYKQGHRMFSYKIFKPFFLILLVFNAMILTNKFLENKFTIFYQLLNNFFWIHISTNHRSFLCL